MCGPCTKAGQVNIVLAGNNEAIMEPKYGDMGNSIRDKHKKEKGDFVMFADDDNWYLCHPLVLLHSPLRSWLTTRHLLCAN